MKFYTLKTLYLAIISLLFISSNVISKENMVLKVNDLRCEYEQDPLGIDVQQPRFTWQIQSSQRNVNQAAYQILVASSSENINKNIGNLWNSGKVESTQSIQLIYNGKPLNSKTKYYWKVRVWNEDKVASSYSEIATFETAMFDASEWKTKWISSPIIDEWYKIRTKKLRKVGKSGPPFYEYAAPLLRKTFESSKNIKSARVYISGLGFYELHLNGKKVGDNILDPAFTDYDDHVLYTTLDITEYLRDGENAIGVMLGNGWYNMPTRASWGFNLAPWRAHPTLKCQIEITYTDKSRKVIVSDETWKYAFGPIQFNSIRQGETYDANKEIEGWDIADFDDSKWNYVNVVRGPAGKLVSQMLPPVKVIKEFPPKKIIKLDQKEYLIDFGQNMAGFIKLKVSGAKGDTIIIKYGERLNPDNSLNQEEIAKYVYEERFQTDIFILKGKGVETFQPRFVYHGFQYVEISGLNKKPTSDQIIGKAISTSFNQAGTIETSSKLLNKIQHNTWWSYVSNFVGLPTDCPHREKLGWTGDAQLASETGLFNFQTQTAYEKWIQDLIDAQKRDGSLPGIAPTNGWGFHWGNGPGFDHAIMKIPWNLYLYSGDVKILKKAYPYMKKYVLFLDTKADSYIVDWGLPDWSVAKTETPADITSTAFYYEDARILAETAKVLGYDKEAEQYSKLATDIKEAFNSKFYDPNKGIYSTGTQTALSCALYFGLVPNNKESKVLNNLEKVITGSDMNIDVGIYGAKFVLNSFTKYNRPEAAYKIVDSEDYPGWGYWIKQGANTLWEKWDGKTHSRNHIMYGDVSAWMYKTLAGIRPDPASPGFKRFFIKPYFPENLKWVEAEHESPYGKIKIHWIKDNGRVSINISVPANTSSIVTLPVKKLKDIIENDKSVKETDYLQLVKKKKDETVFLLASGDYQFSFLY